jgi:outer membrane protein OmpU
MKKALLASTALVAMSGAAYAQGVTLSGSAEMGIADGGDGDAMFHQDVDVTFKMEAMTDAGLTFGTAVDLDEDAGAVGSDDAGVAAYVKGPFGNITLGDTDGGFDWAMSEVGGAGAIADDHTAHAGFDGNSGLDGKGGDGQILRYDNSFGDLGVAISFEQEDGGSDGDVIGVGVTGGFGDVGLGLGFQTHDNASISGASVTAAFGDISGALNFSRLSNDGGDDTTHMGVGATYATGGTTVNVNFGQKDTGDMEQSGFGVGATYDLGGGASIQFGFGNSQNADDTDEDTWSLGLKMGF